MSDRGTGSATLAETYQRDQKVWDGCARTYERQIVGGHPDVIAYEEFEEDLVDRMALFLAADAGVDFKLYDVGCGSARMHQRMGLRIAEDATVPKEDAARIRALRQGNSRHGFDPMLGTRLKRIEGLDFSNEMIAIATEKLRDSGLGSLLGDRLGLEQGSAFDLQPMAAEPLPVLVSVCNSIGVMQGPEGASSLFQSMRRAVEQAGGIAMISGYRKEAVKAFALGNYESTMDVCGQPRWLTPADYTGEQFVKIPRHYKRAYSSDPTIVVDVVDAKGKPVASGVELRRDPNVVQETIASGHIQTYTDYESRWYAFSQFDQWIKEHWAGLNSYHLAGQRLDALRGAPAQLAILDPRGLLKPLIERWTTPL